MSQSISDRIVTSEASASGTAGGGAYVASRIATEACEFRKLGKGSLILATPGFVFAAPSSIAPSGRVGQLRLLGLTAVNADRFAIIDCALQDGIRSSIGAFQ
jgi:hypothetical protein